MRNSSSAPYSPYGTWYGSWEERTIRRYSVRFLFDQIVESSQSFLSYRTSQYKLHYYETPTNIKFVMLTDTKSGSMRTALHQIYVSIYVEYVVKNALSPVEHPGGLGVNNDLFEITLEQFVVRFTWHPSSLYGSWRSDQFLVGSSAQRSFVIDSW